MDEVGCILGVLVVICGMLESYVLCSKWEHSEFLGLLHVCLCKTRLNCRRHFFFLLQGGEGGGPLVFEKTVFFFFGGGAPY